MSQLDEETVIDSSATRVRPARALLLFGLLGLWLVCLGGWERAAAQAERSLQTITIGVSETLYTSVYEEELRPIRAYLEAAGIRVNALRFADDQAVGRQLVSGAVDLGLFSAIAYVRLRSREPSLEAFASHVINGTRFSQSYLVVRRDSPFQDVSSLKGRRFAFTDTDSFGGYLYPRYAIRRVGFDANHFFGESTLTGDYMESLRQVYDGRVDGAAVLDEVLRLGTVEGMPRDAFRVLAKSRRVPYVAYVRRTDLPPSRMEPLRRLLGGHRFTKFYLHVRKPLDLPGPWARLTPRTSAQWVINGFVSASDADFDEVRRVLRFVEGGR